MSEKWLLIRFRAIGDVLMTQWPTTAIHRARPDAELWLASESGFAAGVNRSMVPHLVEVPRGRWKKHRWSPQTWSEQVRFYTALRKEKFDYGVDFQGHSKTALLLRLSGAKHRVQMPGTDALAQRLNPIVRSSRPHKVEQYMDLLAPWGEFVCPERPLMEPVTTPRDGLFVTINTGASSAEKQIPDWQFQQICASLQTASIPIAWVGGPGDPPPPGPGENLVGKTSLAECYAWIAASALHISADTSTGHAAAAYGTPFLTLFQTDRNSPDRFRPYSDRGTVLLRPTEAELEKSLNERLAKIAL
ncbi:MAG: glycosyltransferase family 9 protein [Chthonomonas sp.]|nr:glycosyltransferase family 9 protein [Chthonomonas sp.]